jgi:NAD-dependent dihydropyrimidine dehydrogenase PreA subunit
LSDQRLHTTSNSTGERAAARPDSCNDISGRVAPVVDRDRCEGKADCVRVCPFDVFEIGTLSKQQRRALSLVGRLKAWAHDGKQAFVVNPLDCHACRLCVDACPEHALQLAPLQP